jgi:hypothetical protein
MRTNLLKGFFMAVVMMLPLTIVAQTTVYEIKAPVEDGFVSDPTVITDNNPYLWDFMKVGKSAVDGSANTTSAIIPFRLPARPEGKKVVAASLKVYVSYGREWTNTNVDLYGLQFKKEDDTGRQIFATDHFAGPFGDGTGNGNDKGIQDDYFTKNVKLGKPDSARWEVTSLEADSALVDYINAQYDAGAQEGDWIFLRLSVDNPDMTGSQYFKIEGGDSATPATLTMEIESDESGTPEWDAIITSPTEDGYVSDPSIITDNNPYLWGFMKVGKSAVDGSANTTSAIIPFQLPERPAGQMVTDAALKVYVSYGREWTNTNVDLYGLQFKKEDDTGRQIFAADHYAGPFGNGTGNGTDKGIEDDYFTKNVKQGEPDSARWEETSVNGNSALATYLNEQYDTGAAAGDWVFLRLSVDNPDMTGAQYFKVEGGDSQTPPTLSVKFSGSTAISKVERGSFSIYPNPVTNGKLRMSIDGFESSEVNLSIYTITGKLVYTKNIQSAGSTYETTVDLTPGIYIVNLKDGVTSKTQKMVVR